MPSIGVESLFAVAGELGLRIERFEATRPVDTDANWPGNANWLIWTEAGECLVLRRYHLLSAEKGLAYEFAVLRHLADRGWSVPVPVSELVSFEGRFWAATVFIPGGPHEEESAAQREERGVLLARLHADLQGLELGQRTEFFQACDLDAMGAYQDWELGIVGLRKLRPDLASRAEAAMAGAQQLVAEGNLLELPQTVVHGDFASWNLHFDPAGKLSGVIDFGLTHRDSRSWEFVIARVHRAPELLAGYQEEAARLGHELGEEELAAIPALQRVLRVNMVMAELWNGVRSGDFNLPMIERQLISEQ